MSKKIFLIITILHLIIPTNVIAGSGCCSWHSGESDKCTKDGRSICNDGTISPSCRCYSYNEEDNYSIKEDLNKKGDNKFLKYLNPNNDNFDFIISCIIIFIIMIINFFRYILLVLKSNRLARKFKYKNWKELEKKYMIFFKLDSDFKKCNLEYRINYIAKRRGYENFNYLYKKIMKKK